MDGWLPEPFALVPFNPPPPPAMRRAVRPSRGILAVRVLRPPVPLEVIVDEEARRPRSVKALESRAPVLRSDSDEGSRLPHHTSRVRRPQALEE